MENASKALIMAAEVLIGILILTLAVYLINIFGNSAKEQEEAIYKKSLTEFNAKFTKYETPKTNVTMQQLINDENLQNDYITAADVATLINLVQEYNSKYALNSSGMLDTTSKYSIKIFIGTWSNVAKTEDQIRQKATDTLKESTMNIDGKEVYKRYNCSISMSNEEGDKSITGRVRQININEITS